MLFSCVRPKDCAVLRLPSGIHKIVELIPNTIISIGKYGSFPTNLVLGRPYNVTYEILDREDADSRKSTWLRRIPAAELHAEALSDKDITPSESRDEGEKLNTRTEDGGVEFDIVAEDGSVLIRNNRLTIDDPSRQALSMEEIEELKKLSASTGGSGKDIVEKIMRAHSALSEKTTFSLAKYTLRKSRKYMKRFTILPMDVNLLTELEADKDHPRTMGLRREMLGAITSWANVHAGVPQEQDGGEPGRQIGAGRWLVVDDTCGLIIAALAEKMGILYPDYGNEAENSPPSQQLYDDRTQRTQIEFTEHGLQDADHMQIDQPESRLEEDTAEGDAAEMQSGRGRLPAQSATHSTITMIHPNTQGNLALLKHFGYLAEDPSPSHPLYLHLKTMSWLQVLDPEADSLYHEPPLLSGPELRELKSGKRSVYWRKRRRWERIRRVVDETRAGGFDGLVVASYMKPEGILKHLIPLLRGGGQIAVYSPTVEPLTQLMDYYSRDRKSAYVRVLQQQHHQANGHSEPRIDEDDFPLNPSLVLNPMLQTLRARHWQVLPSRTHPLMTSRGGAEGYLFTGTRVMPANRSIQARGKFGKKRRNGANVNNEMDATSGDIPSSVETAKRAVEAGLPCDRPEKAARHAALDQA